MRKTRRAKSKRLTKIYWQKVRSLLVIMACVIFIFAVYWLVFLSDFFQIKKINVNGIDNQETVLADIKAYFYAKNQKFVPAFVYQIFPQCQDNQANLLLFSSADCSRYLLNKYPEIEKVESKIDIRKSYLAVNLTLREVSFLFCHDIQCYLLDANGVVFGKAPETFGTLIRKIIIHQPSQIVIGAEIFPKADLDILSSFFDLSAKDGSPFSINAVELEKTKSSTIEIATTENWSLRVNFDSNFAEVMKIVKNLKEKELKNKTNELDYIDCRYLPRVYYAFD